MKKLFLIFVLVIAPLSSFSKPIGKDALFAFSKKYSYRDNRTTMKTDNLYSAIKEVAPDMRAVIEAYGKMDPFHQLALSCNHCKIQKVSEAQVDLCKAEIRNIYQEIFQETLSDEILKKIEPPAMRAPTKLIDQKVAEKIRLSTGALKCDSRGGFQFRIDFFLKH